jgi:hypothetical protein
LSSRSHQLNSPPSSPACPEAGGARTTRFGRRTGTNQFGPSAWNACQWPIVCAHGRPAEMPAGWRLVVVATPELLGAAIGRHEETKHVPGAPPKNAARAHYDQLMKQGMALRDFVREHLNNAGAPARSATDYALNSRDNRLPSQRTNRSPTTPPEGAPDQAIPRHGHDQVQARGSDRQISTGHLQSQCFCQAAWALIPGIGSR